MSEVDHRLRDAVRCARRQDGAITRAQAIHAGLTPGRLKHLVASGAWSAPTRGAFVVGEPPDPFRARVRAAVLSCPGALACGTTAARLHGLGALPPEQPGGPVHLLLPRGETRTQRQGIVMHWSTVIGEEVADLDGLLATSVLRTVADVVLRCQRDAAVSVLDSAIQQGFVSPLDLPGIQLMTRGRPGCGRARAYWPLVDGRAESPLETKMRLMLRDRGCPPEELQWVVAAGGTAVARLDLAWPSKRLAVEADGAGPHDQPEALYRDRERQNLLVSLGWRVLRFTWADVFRRPDWAAAQVRRELGPPTQP